MALIYLGGTPDVAPLTIQLTNIVGSRGQDWHLLTAGAFITMLVPLMVLFWVTALFCPRDFGRFGLVKKFSH